MPPQLADGAASQAALAGEAHHLDREDPLAAFAAEFHVPVDQRGRALVYLAGHSLGLQPRAAQGYVEEELAAWRRLGVLAHAQGRRPWIGYHEHASATLADLVGAAAAEVVAMNSLTVNLHLMMVSFFRPAAGRDCVLIERSAFPSDRYAVVSQLRYHGLDEDTHLIEVGPARDAGDADDADDADDASVAPSPLRTEDVLACIEREAPRLALVLLPGVQYLTGQCLDLAPLIAAARRAGAVVGLDLAHAIGNTPLELHDWNADFAVWCSYKYLNGGPGAVGGCFVHERHAGRFDLPRFAGWWGNNQDTRFLMRPGFEPSPGAAGWQVSNPPVLSSAPLLASLELFARAQLPRLRLKSTALTAFLARALNTLVGGRFELITPSAPAARGCQLSLRLPDARTVHDRMGTAGVIVDVREPDILRLAPTPLYNSFADCYAAAAALARALP